MTIEHDGLELFSMAEAVAEIKAHTGDDWTEEGLLSAAVSKRVKVLCHANEVPVNDHRHEYSYCSDDGGNGDAFEEIIIHINPVPKKHTGFFYPASSEGGGTYLKELSRGCEITQGIMTLESGTINDRERCFDDEGYRPDISKFYINQVSLLLLIENILLRNKNDYITLFLAAEAMALMEGGRSAEKLKRRFGQIIGEKHLDRLTNAGEQGKFPVWQARLNGDWYSEWGESVYSTSLVLVEDINRIFNIELPIGNQSLTKDRLDYVIDNWELFKLESLEKLPPSAQLGTKQIYRYIVEQVDAHYDFSNFSMDHIYSRYGVATAVMMNEVGLINGKQIENLENFRKNYLQPATKVLKVASKK